MASAEQKEKAYKEARRKAREAYEKQARSNYDAAVNKALARLDEGGFSKSTMQKRRDTIRAIAHCTAHPEMSMSEAFDQPGAVARTTWYRKSKDWGTHPLMQSVLAEVIRLTREYEEQKAARDQEFDRQYWRSEMQDIAHDMLQKARSMLDWPLAISEVSSEDGRTIIFNPANWTMANVPSLVNAADKAARLAMGLDTDQTTVNVNDWRAELADPEAVAEAEKAQRALALMIAKQRADALAAAADGEGADSD